jgi:hypothetical protein
VNVKLMTEIDGAVTPLADCEWVLFAACGCPVGCMVADIAPSEELAWKEHYPLKRDRDRATREGLRMELMTRARWAAEIMPLMLARNCTHQGS